MRRISTIFPKQASLPFSNKAHMSSLQGKDIKFIETPRVLVDIDKLKSNILNMQKKANEFKINLRPHIKTHKSVKIAALQMDHGAIGITCAKVDEALTFLKHGFRNILIAYPLVQEDKIIRLFRAFVEDKKSSGKDFDLRLIVDSVVGIENIYKAAQIFKLKDIKVYLKIDVGLHRCGIELSDKKRLHGVARRLISKAPVLNFIGILSHAGHVYSAKDREEALKIAKQEVLLMNQAKQFLESSLDIKLQEVSIGSTPTVLVNDHFEGITEIRPGNYVFCDLTPERLSLIDPRDISLSVLATVVSKNDKYYIIDAGSKVLSSDSGAHGSSMMSGYGFAYPLENFNERLHGYKIVKLSEEHGFIEIPPGNVGWTTLHIGSKVRIIPNHSCVVANLSNELTMIKDDRVVDIWNVDARGAVL